MATLDEVKAVAGAKMFEVMSLKAMGAAEFFRKGLGGRQRDQTKASIEAVKKGKAPSFEGTVAESRYNSLNAQQRKCIAALVLCGRLPALKGDGIGISGPTTDSEKLSKEVREKWQELRAALAAEYEIEQLRRLYPRRTDGVRVKLVDEEYEQKEDAPATEAAETEEEEEGEKQA